MKDIDKTPVTFLTKFRTVGFYFSMGLVLLALAGLFSRGLNLALDFTGGYLTEFSTSESVSQQDMQQALSAYLPDGFTLSSANQGHYWTVRQADNVSSVKGADWLDKLAQEMAAKPGAITIKPQEAIYMGSQVGEELIEQGGLALLTAAVVILLYLAVRFECRLATGAVAALCHDVILVLGLFAWTGLSFDLTVLASILAIIGYSLNDSIIVGDKVREFMRSQSDSSMDTIINLAIKSTLVRTLITSGTTLATILSVWLLAGASLSGFSVALFAGIVVGTFSSVVISATVPQLLGLTADYYQKQAEISCQLP
ncbi:protein translocase subunit SecF [Thalassomonas actiniarum]|uniref:Protein translocase subunit SecF n=1 Tax=Thalassomonas actiniarum TaxID=485447 RepID=A0AAE9YS87_9GAMM|nr:protein translocase subunit SecF [Thalassomonas actiniarum]WDD98552.1 protein translocase subunit SecF [Thalassomonas actiniarum]